jgi:AraC family transcriptional regulator
MLVPHAESIVSGAIHIDSVETDRFRAHAMRFAPGLRLPSHYHNEPMLTVPLRGRVDLVSGGRRVACLPGMVFIVPPGEVHESTFGHSGARSVVITPLDSDIAFRELLVVDSPPISRIAAGIVDETKCTDSLSGMAVDGMVLQIIALTLRIDSKMRGRMPQAWLQTVVDVMRGAEGRRVNLSDLAAAVDTTPAYLAKVFRSTYGQPIARFARGLRLEQAAERLRASDASIRHIARDAGFADQSHFTRLFKSVKGITPALYRQEMQRRSPTRRVRHR